MSEINEKPISNTLNIIDRNQDQAKISTKYSRQREFDRYKISQSWDFTPFPKFLFPNEKKNFLNDFKLFFFLHS